jgi:hypothetical protein
MYERQKSILSGICTDNNFDGIYLDVYLSDNGSAIDYRTGVRHRGLSYASTYYRQKFIDDIKPYSNQGKVISEWPQELAIQHANGLRVPTQIQYYIGYDLYAYPIWNTIYHEYILGTDLVSATPGSSGEALTQILWANSNFHFGNMLTLIDITSSGNVINSSLPFFNSYIKSLTDLQVDHANYLRYGSRLRPQSILDDGLIITGSKYSYSSIWMDESKNKFAAFMTNGASSLYTFYLSFSTGSYPVTGVHDVYDITSGNNAYIATYTGGNTAYTYSTGVPAYGVSVLEFRKQ